MRLATTGKNSTFPTITTMLPGGTAGRDENGTYYNALGLESTETMQHVSVIWQRQCIPLGEFAADIHEQAKHKRDIRLQAPDLRLTDNLTLADGTGFTLTGLKSMPRESMKQGVIDYLAEDLAGYGDVSEEDTARARRDLAHYLNLELAHKSGERDATLQARMEKKQAQLDAGGLPKSRVDTLKAEITDLSRRIEESKGFLVRTRRDDGGNQVVRYIASDRYGVIDNTDVMRIIAESLPGGWGDSLASHAWNDGDSMLGNVLLPDYLKNRPDSEYGVGFAFKNSEIGRCRFEIQPFLFRAICLNGCIWGRSDSVIGVDKKHLGEIKIEEIAADVRKAIQVALAEGEQVLELFDKSKEVTVTNQPALVAALARENKLTIPQGRAWLAAIAEEPGDTVFHTVQGLTLAAQGFAGDARRTMEEVAGLIVAPSLTADIDAIAAQWVKFAAMGDRLSESQLNTYSMAGK
jgi:hypothetical protein